MFNIPLLLTWLRIAAIPFVIILYFLPVHSAHLLAMSLFILAALTDWLDGYLARSWAQSTRLGAFLDPVADKLLVALTLVMLVSQLPVVALFVPAGIIISREIAISALREWMAEMGKRATVGVNQIAKIKTGFQMVAIPFLLGYSATMPHWILVIGVVLLWIAALLTLWSMIIYLKLAWPDLTLSGER